MSSTFVWHETDKIDSDIFWVDFVFGDIQEDSSPQGEFFHATHGIKRMSVVLIFSVSYLDKNGYITIAHDKVNFSSFYLHIALDASPSLLLKIAQNNILPMISDTSSRGRHTFRIIEIFL
jgi:hypothetical protein